MDKKWTILYCDASIRFCPIGKLLDSLMPAEQTKVLRKIELLENMGPNMPRPHADLLQDGIHELRIKLSGDQIRLLYFFCHEIYIVFYHAFFKTTSRVPGEFITKTMEYRERFLMNYSKEDLKTRACGFI
jgi:hypothetical protein